MNYLFQNKKKNIIAICFSLIYLVALIVNGPLWGVSRLIIPIALLVLLFTANKEYRIKKWILPTALGIGLIGNIRTLIAQFDNVEYAVNFYGSQPLYIMLLISATLTTIAAAVMFVGALLDFRRPLKYGALAVSVITLISLVVDFFAVGAFEYIQSVPDGFRAINIYALAVSLTQILFYIGIFLLALGKEEE